jgi:hypothetical protein
LNISGVFLVADLHCVVVLQEEKERLLCVVFYEEGVIDLDVIDERSYVLHVLTGRRSDSRHFV